MTFRERFFKLGKKYIHYRLRSGRGGTYTAEFTSLLDNATRAGAVTILLKSYCNFLLPWWSFPLLYLLQKVVEYFIGQWDEHHGGLWKYENNYQATRVNPWNEEVIKRLEKIEQNTYGQ